MCILGASPPHCSSVSLFEEVIQGSVCEKLSLGHKDMPVKCLQLQPDWCSFILGCATAL